MINVAININEVIIRDANFLFHIEKFTKEFARIYFISLIDFFFEDDQVILIEKSRDLIAFIIFLNFFRMIRVLQNAINSMI